MEIRPLAVASASDGSCALRWRSPPEVNADRASVSPRPSGIYPELECLRLGQRTRAHRKIPAVLFFCRRNGVNVRRDAEGLPVSVTSALNKRAGRGRAVQSGLRPNPCSEASVAGMDGLRLLPPSKVCAPCRRSKPSCVTAIRSLADSARRHVRARLAVGERQSIPMVLVLRMAQVRRSQVARSISHSRRPAATCEMSGVSRCTFSSPDAFCRNWAAHGERLAIARALAAAPRSRTARVCPLG